jgi:thiamine-phosphate pyrophosphorylase
MAQDKGVAVIVDGSVTVALRAKADGAHISGAGEELVEAVKKLSPKYIVGAGGLPLRDDAMQAGEAGVDYVLFDAADRDALIERVAWWAELFNTPCVARADTLDDVSPLAQAGADFVMLDDAVWRSDEIGAALRAALENMQKGGQA